MSSARFRRPDGRFGTYGQWLAEVSAKWSALSSADQAASRDAAAGRLAAQIRAQAAGEPTLLHLYDEIGWFGVWPADVVEALAAIKGDVEVHVNSPGGNVFDGLAIYAALQDHPGEVSVVVDGLAASAASFIAQAAAPGKLQMTPNGTMMIHDAWGLCAGNAAEMAEMAALLEETSDNIASIYAERGTLTLPEYRDLMKAETWAVGQKAVNLGLADSVRKKAAAADAPPVAASVPWQVTIMDDVPGACCDQCGPDCQCMDPAQARGHRHVRNAAADDSAWDASKAWAAGAASDDPAAFYNAICAGKKAGDPATQGAHALPHHYHPGDPPNRHGVSAALGRLDSTQGLTNRSAAEAHLKAHQSAMGSGDDASGHAGMPAWLMELTAKEAAN